jgi:hypothetical protein
MNNANMPASPIMCDKGRPTHYSFLLNATLGDDKRASGLTKREYFAGLAMQGFIAAGCITEDPIASAVIFADELLARLEK